jgi:hypothetical protein
LAKQKLIHRKRCRAKKKAIQVSNKISAKTNSLVIGAKVAEGAATKDGKYRSKNALHC